MGKTQTVNVLIVFVPFTDLINMGIIADQRYHKRQRNTEPHDLDRGVELISFQESQVAFHYSFFSASAGLVRMRLIV